MKITELFVKIQDTAGTNDKKQLLKDNLNPTIQQIFEDTYGSQKYYIKQFFPVLNLFGTLTLDNDYKLTVYDEEIKPLGHNYIDNVCTNCNSDVLFSHRATKGQRGSLAAFMALK